MSNKNCDFYCKTSDIEDHYMDKMSKTEELLQGAVRAYNAGDMELFKEKSVLLYNGYCGIPSPLVHNNSHPYLLGTMYSYMIPFYSFDISKVVTLAENATYCFMKVVVDGDNIFEKQSAAIRLVLLLDDNWSIMQHIITFFIKTYGEQLYRDYSELSFSIITKGMTPMIHEYDILKRLGGYCIRMYKSDNIHTYISASEMSHYDSCLSNERFRPSKGTLLDINDNKLIHLFYEFITGIVDAPIERRMIKM